mgnify:FL=1
MPNLSTVSLSKTNAFQYRSDVTMNSARFPYESRLDAGELAYHDRIVQSHYECWSSEPVRADITDLSIGNNKCNSQSISSFDLSKYGKLRTLTIGSESFMYVNTSVLIGFPDLERVVIGDNSFTRHKDSWLGGKYYSNTYFHVKNCSSLRELRIGRHSFSDYGALQIDNTPSLETFVLGTVNEWSNNFVFASLELRSMGAVVENDE